MALARLFDWASRLQAFLQARRRTPFAWGIHDCALFAADGVLAMTGTDLAADHRGAYDDEDGAIAAIGGDLEAFAVGIAGAHELEEIAPGLAQRGDVALFPGMAGATLGIIVGAHGACCRAPAGYALLPRAQASRAWRV